MEYTMLRNSDLKVSRLCMGGCPMGGYGWGDTQENELIEAVHTAVDQGVNFFDTADTYGLGQSEKTLGKALGSHRKDVVIASKFGVRIENGKTFYDNSSSWIKKAVEGSLRRLGTDYIDLYQIHYRDGKTPIGEVIETLEEMKKKGYIRYYGLSNIHEDDIEEIKPFRGKFVSFQDEYSLACRKNESDMKSIAQDLEMTILTWGSLGQGILTGKYTKENVNFGNDDRRSRDIYVNFHGEKLLKNLEIVEVMRTIADKYEKPVAAVAIRYILDFLSDSVVLCGAKRPSQILGNIEGLGWNLEKVVCIGGGFVYGSLGMSHQATEDLAILRALPDVVVMAPADLVEAEECTKALAAYPGTAYLRLGRGGEKRIHDHIENFQIGKAIKVKSGEKIAIFSTGAIFEEVNAAYDILVSKGYSPAVYTFPTVKPIDKEVIEDCAKEFEVIVTCEEHNIVGGFGSAVAEVMAEI